MIERVLQWNVGSSRERGNRVDCLVGIVVVVGVDSLEFRTDVTCCFVPILLVKARIRR